jgi:peptidyl-prolyl cis-trans isomerase C
VDGEEIRRSDVIEAQKLLAEQYRQAPFDRIFEPLLERMINSRLTARAGRKENLHKGELVRRQVARFEDQIVERVFLDIRIKAALTDDALRRRYADAVTDFKPEAEVSARHILVKTEEEARAVIEELDGGADFAALARTKSTGPSKTKGGDLGYFTRERMVPEFAAAAFALKKGAYTGEPVQTQFGWHVIKLEDRRQTKPADFEEQKISLREEMSRKVVTDLVASLKRSARIERFDSSGAPRKKKPAVKAN